jgi:hypothetical protein
VDSPRTKIEENIYLFELPLGPAELTVLPGHLHKSAMMHFSQNGRRATQT